MTKNESLPTKLLILISLLQGLALLYLHQSIEFKFWPYQSPMWLFAFYSMAFIWPTMLLLSLTKHNILKVVKLTLPFALIAGMLGYYIGHQATPIEHIRFDNLLFAFILTMAIATFKALMYSQQYASGENIHYSALFKWSWRNFLTLSLSLLFAGSFWLILMLWGALFDAINIKFFSQLFKERWFYYPAVALANGFGIVIFRNLTHVIDIITRLQQALMKFLLIILVLVSLLFLGALPFTGLDPLWKSGGSTLILWMQALMLFFVNAVYQDEPQTRPYHLWLHRFIYLGVALLPIYSIISFYGLSLRVDQYGWSMARCWAFLIWFLLALLPIGYWYGIAKFRDNWLQQLSKVNVAIGLVVLAAMVLVNSPALDFRKIVVASQLQRLAEDPTLIDDLDIRYFRLNLAKPGYDALQTIKEKHLDSHPHIANSIALFYSDSKNKISSLSEEQFTKSIDIISNNTPPLLLATIYHDEIKINKRSGNTGKYYLFSIELNENSQPEFILVRKYKTYSHLSLYYLSNEKWLRLSVNYAQHKKDNNTFYEALRNQDIEVVQPEWREFKIGNKKFKVQ